MSLQFADRRGARVHRRGALSRQHPAKETKSPRSACGAVVSLRRVREDDGKDCEQDAHGAPQAYVSRAKSDVGGHRRHLFPAVLTGTASFELRAARRRRRRCCAGFFFLLTRGCPYFVAEIDGRVARGPVRPHCPGPARLVTHGSSRLDPRPLAAQGRFPSHARSAGSPVLLSPGRQVHCRQRALALQPAFLRPNALVLLFVAVVSPVGRDLPQGARRLDALGRPLAAVSPRTPARWHLANGWQGGCLATRPRGDGLLLRRRRPCSSSTRPPCPRDLYRSVRPMLAVSRGRLVALSTAKGQQGWFYEESAQHRAVETECRSPGGELPRVLAAATSSRRIAKSALGHAVRENPIIRLWRRHSSPAPGFR